METDFIKFHGRKSAIGTSALQVVNNNDPMQKGLLVKAGPSNSGIVYLGNSSSVTADSADSTDGFPLEAGDAIFWELKDASTLYAIADASGQKLFFTAI